MFDWLGLTTLLALGYALFIGVCAAHIAGRLRRPPRRTYAWAVSKGLPGDPGELTPRRAFEEREVVWREPGGGGALIGGEAREVVIPVWIVPGDAPRGPVVVLAPGWGDSRVGGLVRVAPLLPVASRVTLFDPPGLGASEFRGGRKGRRPKWSMSTRDHAALLAVVDACAEPGDEVVLFGWSAGAGASIVAAEEFLSRADTVAVPTPHSSPRSASTLSPTRGERDQGRNGWRVIGVIAEAPYRLPWTPARNVIRAAGLPWFLCGPLAFVGLGIRVGVGPRWRGFDRAAHVEALKGRTPVLVLHGADDEVCPIQDGRELASAGGGEIVEIPRGRHNDLWVEESHREASAAAVRAFIQKCTVETRGRGE